MPWQPLPKMHVHRDVSQVRSQRKTCSSSAGSGNSTQARAKSRPVSSEGSGSAAGVCISTFSTCLMSCGVSASMSRFFVALPGFAFFVFGTRPE